MKLFKFFAAIFLCAVMTMHGASAADTAPAAPTEAGNFFQKMDGAVREVGRKASTNLSASMKTTGLAIAADLKTTSLSIAGGLALIYLLYEVLQFLGGRTRSMLTVLFDVGVPCAFAAAFIVAYPDMLAKFDVVLDVFRNLGSNNGGNDAFNKILDVYSTVFANITTAISKAFAANMKFGEFVTNPGAAMTHMIDLLATVIFSIAVLFLLVIGVAEVLGLLLIGPFLFAVGVAFGPIMIAGLVTPWTRDYFTKWLQFIVIAAGLQGVINVIFTIAQKLMLSVNVGEANGEPTAVALVITAVLLLTINSMVSQAPGIASALFPGTIGVARSSGGAVNDAAQKTANTMKKGTNASGKTAASVVRGGIGGVKNSIRFAQKLGGKKTP